VAAAAAGFRALSRRLEVVRLLADGHEHSGEALAAALRISRAAVWKHVQQLSHWGLEVEAVPGRGYRLALPVDLLDEAVVYGALPGLARDRLRHLQVADEVESTNEVLLEADDVPAGRFDACLAEFQSRGRGRRGRSWLGSFGSGLCLSVNWRFEESPAQVSALPLAIGVAIRRALGDCGVAGTALKWPNDLLLEGRKLGGVLVEMRIESAGPAYAVVGVGLNCSLPEAVRRSIRETGIDVASLDEAGVAAEALQRSKVAAAVLGRLCESLEEFDQRGFAPFQEEWSAADALHARPVRVLHGEEVREGVARGIDLDGALLVEIDGRVSRFVAGEVTLRPAA
jgi:BirA family biotin operon repressor/biotin-[acetyl-CoA-carboxylase] ligase